MTASIDDYEQTYQQAYKAYVQRNYEEAATLIDRAVQHQPDDPNTHLLRGHVYFVLQKYDVAKEEYLHVLDLTEQQEIIDFAHNGLENISQYQQQLNEHIDVDNYQENNSLSSDVLHDHIDVDNHEENKSLSSDFLHRENLENLDDLGEFNSKSLYVTSFSEHEAVEEIELTELTPNNPFNLSTKNASLDSTSNSSLTAENNPFILNNSGAFSEPNITSDEQQSEELSAFGQQNVDDKSSIEALTLDDSKLPTTSANEQENLATNNISAPFTRTPINNQRDDQENINTDTLTVHNNFEDENLVLIAGSNHLDSTTNSLGKSSPENLSNSSAMTSKLNNDLNQAEKQSGSSTGTQQNNFDDEDSFDFEAFESAFGSESFTSNSEASGIHTSKNITHSKNIEFLDDFDEFDDLGNIPGFDFTEESSFRDETLRSGSLSTNGRFSGITESATKASSNDTSSREAELFSITASGEQVPVFTQSDLTKVEPQVTVEQGFLAPLENAPLQTKQWFIAGTVGISCALVVAVVSFAAANFSPSQQRSAVRNTGWVMTLAAGIAGFATASVMGNLTMRQIRRTTKDLQAQFDAVRQGNLNVQATVYSEDELGQLATGFNEMARVIFTTTHEATRKAQEQEEAKENLQRQVIRLLDDVEGAARGDLTVQAEVTADVLGAVADAFNLTIQNLRDIVQQVKVAAKEVTKGATNSETFARALSSDALRQAEELAVTLNSVQVMTDSIQRVAEAAREAEAVARNASEIALKGGDAVENTVAGILEIRETVAETTRKVKRLAESSQEISKIVALISQIASRTNLLALNASIEAARAGEAGRGFAIVADEVRQLADRSAKSLKEIEEIVRQIQSETSSVMTAMEEGTQQVIKGTKLAEEAKRSLENIIQVANRIDILVGSITTDTVEQTETSRAVAQVMQSVELTAQETSQEAQRVSGALQHLVGVSRDLIASVERFRVETAESR